MSTSEKQLKDLKEKKEKALVLLAERKAQLRRLRYGDVDWQMSMYLDEVPAPLPPDFDLGFCFVDDSGMKLESFLEEPGDRDVYAELLTWTDISAGARHWYAQLRLQCCDWREIDTGEIRCGTVCGEIPDPCRLRSLEIRRPLLQKELELYSDRWARYREGDLVRGFLSEKSARRALDLSLKKWFPGWIHHLDFR
jgi:hypothetical protein